MKFTEKHSLRNLFNRGQQETAVSIGKLGEEAAVKALKKNGYRIIERNFRTKQGEIDIIAKDGEYISFVEVRLRKNDSFGSPAESITEGKRSRIIKAAQAYILKKRLYDTPMRFDAVLINAFVCDKKLQNTRLEIIKDAFRL